MAHPRGIHLGQKHLQLPEFRDDSACHFQGCWASSCKELGVPRLEPACALGMAAGTGVELRTKAMCRSAHETSLVWRFRGNSSVESCKANRHCGLVSDGTVHRVQGSGGIVAWTRKRNQQTTNLKSSCSPARSLSDS